MRDLIKAVGGVNCRNRWSGITFTLSQDDLAGKQQLASGNVGSSSGLALNHVTQIAGEQNAQRVNLAGLVAGTLGHG